jgi:hypothetical protein
MPTLPEGPTPFPEYEIAGVGTVIKHDGSTYIVRTSDNRVIGFPTQTEPSEANGAADWAAWESRPPVPPPPVRLTPLEVIGRLTQTEEVALTTSTDLAVAIVRQRFIAATYIDSSDTRTAEGIAVLVAKGIITQARANEIFS